MDDADVRWEQRFANYQKALTQLGEAVELFGERDLSNLEEQGLIKAFEYTHQVIRKVVNQHYGLFVALEEQMNTLKSL